jgi:hypothetical protein
MSVLRDFRVVDALSFPDEPADGRLEVLREDVVPIVRQLFAQLDRAGRSEVIRAVQEEIIMGARARSIAVNDETMQTVAMNFLAGMQARHANGIGPRKGLTGAGEVLIDVSLDRWMKEGAEWQAIARELIGAAAGKPVTPHRVTLEQRKRMLARGERPLTREQVLTLIGASWPVDPEDRNGRLGVDDEGEIVEDEIPFGADDEGAS